MHGYSSATLSINKKDLVRVILLSSKLTAPPHLLAELLQNRILCGITVENHSLLMYSELLYTW